MAAKHDAFGVSTAAAAAAPAVTADVDTDNASDNTTGNSTSSSSSQKAGEVHPATATSGLTTTVVLAPTINDDARVPAGGGGGGATNGRLGWIRRRSASAGTVYDGLQGRLNSLVCGIFAGASGLLKTEVPLWVSPAGAVADTVPFVGWLLRAAVDYYGGKTQTDLFEELTRRFVSQQRMARVVQRLAELVVERYCVQCQRMTEVGARVWVDHLVFQILDQWSSLDDAVTRTSDADDGNGGFGRGSGLHLRLLLSEQQQTGDTPPSALGFRSSVAGMDDEARVAETTVVEGRVLAVHWRRVELAAEARDRDVEHRSFPSREPAIGDVDAAVLEAVVGMEQALEDEIQRLGDRVGVVEQQTQAMAQVTVEALPHFTFHKEIEDKSKEFTTGTQAEVVQAFEAFLEATIDNNMFLLFGEAGTGKSTISAMLCDRFAYNVVAVHFCQLASEPLSNVRNIVTSLVYQLAQAVPAYCKAVEAVLNTADNANKVVSWQVAELVRELLQEPLKTVTDPFDGMSAEDRAKYVGQRLVVLIDALDESEHNGVNDLLDFLSKQGLPFPSWLGMVVTSRPEEAIVSALEERYPNPVLLTLHDFVLATLERARADIAENEGYDWADVIKCLQVVVVAREALTVDAIARLAGCDAETAHAFFDDFLKAFFPQRVSASCRCPVVTFYHKSIRDIVTDDDLGSVRSHHAELFVDPSEGQRRIAEACYELLVDSSAASKSVTGASCLVLRFDEAMKAKEETHAAVRYAVRHAAEHLCETGRVEDAVGLLCNLQMPELRLVLEGGIKGGLGAGQALVAELLELAGRLASAVGDPGDKDKRAAAERRLAEYTRFLRSHVVHWADKGPRLVGSYAWNYPDKTVVFEDAQAMKAWWQARGDWLEWANKVQSLSAEVMCLTHGYGVSSVAYSCDGKLIASGCKDNAVRLFDAATGGLVATLKGHTDSVTSVAFSPDCKLVVSGSRDRTVRLWDVASGEEVKQLTGHPDYVRSVAFSPDGKLVVSGSSDTTVRLWDVASGEEVKQLTGHTNEVTSVAFSPDGKLVMSGSQDKTVRLWDVHSGEEVKQLTGHTGHVNSVAFSPTFRSFSPDFKLVVSGSEDTTTRQWDVASEEELKPLTANIDITSVALSLDGKLVVSGSQDMTVRLWDVASGEEVMQLQGHTGEVTSVAFSPNGKLCASASKDKTVRLWDCLTGEELRTLAGHRGEVTSVAFSPDGQHLMSGSDDKTVRLWDVASGAEIKQLQGHTHEVTSVAFSPDGKLLASSSRDKSLRLWDKATAQATAVIEHQHARVSSMAFSGDGRRIVAAVGDERQDKHLKVHAWHCDTFKAINTTTTPISEFEAFGGSRRVGTRGVVLVRSRIAVLNELEGRALFSMGRIRSFISHVHLEAQTVNLFRFHDLSASAFAAQMAARLGGKAYRRAKLMLVGQGRAGKTSLVRSFTGVRFQEDEASTCGAEMTVNRTVVGARSQRNMWEKRVETSVYEEALVRDAARRRLKLDEAGEDMSGLVAADLASEQLARRRKFDRIQSHGVGPKVDDLASLLENNDDEDVADGGVAGGSAPAVPGIEATATAEPGGSTSDCDERDAADRGDGDDENAIADSDDSESEEEEEVGPNELAEVATAARTDDDEALANAITFTIWDYGGQEVFYTLHHLFLTDYGVYIVLFNMSWLRDESSDEYRECLSLLRFWFNSVALHTAHRTEADGSDGSAAGTMRYAPILLVGTHKDEVLKRCGDDAVQAEAEFARIDALLTEHFGEMDVVRQSLLRYRPVVAKQSTSPPPPASMIFFPVDNSGCGTGFGADDPAIQAVMDTIQRRVQTEAYFTRLVADRWLRLYDELVKLSRRKASVTLQRCLRVARKCGFSEARDTEEGPSLVDEVMFSLLYFHKLGLLMYKTDEQWKHTVVLNPTSFFIRPATQVIREPSVHHNVDDKVRRVMEDSKWADLLKDWSMLDRRLLDELWAPLHLDVDLLVNLMCAYGLFVPWSTLDEEREVYFVPSMLKFQRKQSRVRAFLADVNEAQREATPTAYLVFGLHSASEGLVEFDRALLATRFFLPNGLFSRLLGRIVRETVHVVSSRVSFSEHTVVISARAGTFSLHCCAGINAIRVHVKLGDPRRLLRALVAVAGETIRQVMPRLGCFTCVPVQSWQQFEAGDDHLVRLRDVDALLGTTDGDGGEGTDVDESAAADGAASPPLLTAAASVSPLVYASALTDLGLARADAEGIARRLEPVLPVHLRPRAQLEQHAEFDCLTIDKSLKECSMEEFAAMLNKHKHAISSTGAAKQKPAMLKVVAVRPGSTKIYILRSYESADATSLARWAKPRADRFNRKAAKEAGVDAAAKCIDVVPAAGTLDKDALGDLEDRLIGCEEESVIFWVKIMMQKGFQPNALVIATLLVCIGEASLPDVELGMTNIDPLTCMLEFVCTQANLEELQKSFPRVFTDNRKVFDKERVVDIPIQKTFGGHAEPATHEEAVQPVKDRQAADSRLFEGQGDHKADMARVMMETMEKVAAKVDQIESKQDQALAGIEGVRADLNKGLLRMFEKLDENHADFARRIEQFDERLVEMAKDLTRHARPRCFALIPAAQFKDEKTRWQRFTAWTSNILNEPFVVVFLCEQCGRPTKEHIGCHAEYKILIPKQTRASRWARRLIYYGCSGALLVASLYTAGASERIAKVVGGSAQFDKPMEKGIDAGFEKSSGLKTGSVCETANEALRNAEDHLKELAKFLEIGEDEVRAMCTGEAVNAGKDKKSSGKHLPSALLSTPAVIVLVHELLMRSHDWACEPDGSSAPETKAMCAAFPAAESAHFSWGGLFKTGARSFACAGCVPLLPPLVNNANASAPTTTSSSSMSPSKPLNLPRIIL